MMAPKDAPPPASALPHKRGYLLALGQRGRDWKSRYFVMKDNFLHYFKKQGDPKPDGVIPLEACQVGPSKRQGDNMRPHCFDLVACSRSYVLSAESQKDCGEWISAIAKASRLTINDFFSIRNTLGEGTFSVVKYAIKKDTGKAFAIKIIEKSALAENRESLLTEIAVLKQVKHKNIISLIDIFETRHKLYLVMDLLTGGELFDRIMAKGSFSEKDASVLIGKICDAVGYLHRKGIIHRDLKPENLLYQSEAEDAEIKIADFGLSKLVSQGDILRTACGTPNYVAPEVLALEGYSREVDMWSIGVILYILLCGFPPFYAESEAEMFAIIKRGEFDFPEPYWTHISASAKNLVQEMLQRNPAKRITPAKALEHPWVAGNDARTTADDALLGRLAKFHAASKFRAGVAKIIAINRFKNLGKKGTARRLGAAKKEGTTAAAAGGAAGAAATAVKASA